jgi:hypothetical protein
MRLVWLVLLSACGWFPTPAVKVAEPGDGSVFGLRLGVTTGPEVEAWAAARGLTCTASLSARRETTQLRCSNVPPELFPERASHGPISDFVVAWPDKGPVHFVSMWRRYSIPADAVVDYKQAVGAVSSSLGPASRAGEEPTEAALSGKMVHLATEWKRDDLAVSVGVLRAGAAFVSLSEQWMVPGVEAQVAARKSHGSSGATYKADDAAAKPDAP